MITRAENRKVMELSDKVLQLVDVQVREATQTNEGIYSAEGLTQSDLQGAIEAIIMEAIAYGKKTDQGEIEQGIKAFRKYNRRQAQ